MVVTTMVMMLSLAGTSWAMPDKPKQFVEFNASKISGNAGCNHFNGSFGQNGATVEMGRLATTRMACKPDIMIEEAKFLHNLEQTASFEVSGSQLVLKNTSGDIILMLNRKDVG